MENNNYQDINALLQTLSSYGPSLLQPQQQLQPEPYKDPATIDGIASSQAYDPYSAGIPWPSVPEQVGQSSAQQGENSSQYQPTAYEISAPSLYNQTGACPEPSAVNPHPTLGHASQGYQAHHPGQVQPVPRPSIPAQKPIPITPAITQPPSIDARTITDWPTAIRYITKLSRNPELGRAIQKLINNQHDNERQWWAGRQALIEKHKARVTGRKELDDVLKSVGALAGLTGRGSGEKVGDEKEELRMYDLKVHRAQVQMEKAFVKDLEGMGVPFFGTRVDLVVEDEEAEGRQATKEKKVTKKELRELQMKMIQHLEDMYKD